jgi:DNA polymerase (family 10)
VHAQAARDLGLLVAISSGARGAAELEQIRFGVAQARRGWLERGDALNTRPLAQLRGLLRRAR